MKEFKNNNFKVTVTEEEVRTYLLDGEEEILVSVVEIIDGEKYGRLYNTYEDEPVVSENLDDTFKVVVEWDCDEEDGEEMPPEIIRVPIHLLNEDDLISDYLSDVTGYCHCSWRYLDE